jgi:hypothetical protein
MRKILGAILKSGFAVRNLLILRASPEVLKQLMLWGATLAGLTALAPFASKGTAQTSLEHEHAVYVRKFFIPGYPFIARQALTQGVVDATVHIRADGTVDSVSDVRGAPPLRQVVGAALESWEFVVVDRQPTALTMRFRFSLQGREKRECVVNRISGTLPDEIEIVVNPTVNEIGPDVVDVPKKKPKK